MSIKLRPSGIEGLGDISWGTHFCLFYETKEDLLDIFIPFFRAGLEHQQFCLWVASEPLTLEEVGRVMHQALPDFERYLATGQMEITPSTEWYPKDARFDAARVLQGWLDKLDQALAKGFSGVRFAVNLLLEKKDWVSFSRYEGKLDETLRDRQIEGLCAYNLNRFSAANVLDIMHNHQFTLARRNGNWESLEGAQLRRTREEVLTLNNELEQRVAERTFELEATNAQLRREIGERKRAEEAIRKSEQVLREAESLGHTGSWEQNLVTGEIFYSEENQRLFFGDDRSKGVNFEDYTPVIHPDDRDYVLRRRAELLEEEGPSDIEYRVIWPDGSVHVIFGRATVVYDELGQAIRVHGTNVDITERKQVEEEIRRHAARMEALAEISQALAEVGLDVQAVFETIVRHTAELIGDTCGIRLLSSDEQWLQSITFHNPNPEVKALMRLLHPTTPTSATHSWLTPVLRTGQPLLIPIITQEQLRQSVQPEYLPFFEQVGLHSLLIVPLRVKDRVIGTLGLSRDQPGHPYTSDDQVLLQDLADRASLTIQNAQLFEQVQGAREQLGGLSRRLLEVQESERRALTTELHDRVGQNLTGLSINLQNMKALLPDETVQTLAMKFDDAQALVEDTTRQIRDIMAELHLPELEDYGLAVALETYAERAAARGNLKLVTNLPDLAAPPLPSDVRIALFRSAQEAINNVMKHADATQLKVSLEQPDGRIRLSVEDNGRGFDPDFASHKETQTWGLKIMRERIESIGGNLQIKSELGKGTQITFEVERPS